MTAINRKNNFTWVALTVVILLFYILFLRSSSNVLNRHSYWYNGYFSEISEVCSYEEEIYCNSNNLSAISVVFCNYERANSGTVYLDLYDEDGTLIDSWEYDAATIGNEVEYTLSLDNPISDSKEKTYTLRISSNSVPGQGVTLCSVYDHLLYNLDYENSSVLMTILKFCPFVLIPLVFYKLRDNTWGTAYALYCVFIIALHLYMPTNTNDDLYFSRVNNDYTWGAWIAYRWNSGSSRFLQESVGYFVVDRPMLWMFADTVMVSLLPVFINRTLGAEGYTRLYALAAIPLYPILDMRSAGWMCTTMPYIWAVFPAFVLSSILRKVMDNKNIQLYEYLIFFICLVYAGNHELMAFYLFCIILFCLFSSLIKKGPSRLFLVIATVVSMLNFVVVLICPGAKVRGQLELIHFPGYENLGFLDKVFLGINRCLEVNLVRDNHEVFTVMCIVIAFAVFMNTRNALRRIAALFPVLIQFALNSLIRIDLTDRISTVQLSTRTVGLTIFAVLLLASLVYSVFNIYREGEDGSCLTSRGLLINIVLVAGLMTTAAMAFSPTLYVSEYRTSCFTYFGMIYVTVDAAVRLTDKHKPDPKGIAPAVIACEVVLLTARLLSLMEISFI